MLVVDVLGDAGVVAADRAILVAAELERAELHLKRIVLEEAADEGVAALEDDFDRLGRLERTDRTRQDAENARLCACIGKFELQLRDITKSL